MSWLFGRKSAREAEEANQRRYMQQDALDEAHVRHVRVCMDRCVKHYTFHASSPFEKSCMDNCLALMKETYQIVQPGVDVFAGTAMGGKK